MKLKEKLELLRIIDIRRDLLIPENDHGVTWCWDTRVAAWAELDRELGLKPGEAENNWELAKKRWLRRLDQGGHNLKEQDWAVCEILVRRKQEEADELGIFHDCNEREVQEDEVLESDLTMILEGTVKEVVFENDPEEFEIRILEDTEVVFANDRSEEETVPEEVEIKEEAIWEECAGN